MNETLSKTYKTIYVISVVIMTLSGMFPLGDINNLVMSL
jgi:hypothetical protein